MKKLLFIFYFFLPMTGKRIIAQDPESKTQIIQALTTRIDNLKTRIDNLHKKLSFDGMNVKTLISGDDNMTSTITDGVTRYRYEIKIDDPLCNNNPKAVILAMKQKNLNNKLYDAGRTEAISVYYNEYDKYWYIITPSWQLKGIEINITVNIATEDGEYYGHRMGEVYFFDSTPYLKDTKGSHFTGVAYIAPKPMYRDEKYSIIIFKKSLYMQSH